MQIKTIIFDLDGTLVDSAHSIGKLLNQMRGEKNLAPCSIEKYRGWISLGARDLIANAMEIDVDEIDSYLGTFRGLYANTKTSPKSIFPNVYELLSDFHAAGIDMAICSNKPVDLCHKVLEDTSLSMYFKSVVGGGSTPEPKPSRAPVDLVLSDLGCNHEGAIFVGDSSVDLGAANSSGIPFVFFSGGYNDGVDVSNVFKCINSMSELKSLVLENGMTL